MTSPIIIIIIISLGLISYTSPIHFVPRTIYKLLPFSSLYNGRNNCSRSFSGRSDVQWCHQLIVYSWFSSSVLCPSASRLGSCFFFEKDYFAKLTYLLSGLHKYDLDRIGHNYLKFHADPRMCASYVRVRFPKPRCFKNCKHNCARRIIKISSYSVSFQ